MSPSDTLSKPELVVLVGPTASGKSDTAMAAAVSHGNTHILVCDAMQVYRGMNIGTAKPTSGDQVSVVHHGLDLVDPNGRFTVSDYQ
ncbi:MAG: isopentenyl transferase family protein, partial [Actinomycetota bacterium]